MTKDLTRSQKELFAAALLERERRRLVAMNAEPVVYGIYDHGDPDPVLVRCWQQINKEWVEVDKRPSVTIPLKAERALLIPKPIKILVGGRGSGKSELAAAVSAARVKDQGIKVGCYREFQNSISDSVHSIIAKHVKNKCFDGFSVMETKIDHKNGGQVRYRGLARNPDGIKSSDGFSMGWCEEAQTMSARSIELLEPTFREEGSEIWYTLNRGSSADPISQEHLKPYEKELLRDGYYEDEVILIIEMNYRDNPWFPEALDVKRRKNKETWTAAKYAHVWDGAPSDEVESSIIRGEWFDAAIDAHTKLGFKPNGVKVAAFDPSDEGGDSKGYAQRHGSVVTEICELLDGDAYDGCDWATSKAIQWRAENFVMDCDGLGATLRDNVGRSIAGKRLELKMFKGSETPDNKDLPYIDALDEGEVKTNRETFKNKRAQYYARLRDRFYKTYRAVKHGDYIDPDELISLSPTIKHMTAIRAEVCRIPKKVNGNGVFQIMSKADMIRPPLNLPSPNMADALMMLMIEPEPVCELEDFEFSRV